MKVSQKLIKVLGIITSLVATLSLISYVSVRIYQKAITSPTWDNLATSLWNLRLNDKMDLTLGKICLAIFLLALGWVSAKWISHRFSSHIVGRMWRNKGAVAAVENLTYYILLIIFGLIALHVAQVPLTIFTLFGGALAIGLGFGSQNILSNFISGIILQVEQPVKVGDIIEVEGTIGSVQHIGGRSTKLIASNNTHIIIPNSYFLDKKFINWTLTDNVIRSKIEVSFMPNSQLEDIEAVIADTLQAFPRILSIPQPKILLQNFGGISIDYMIYFWLPIETSLDRTELESNFRKLLLKNINNRGVSLALPPTLQMVKS